MTCEDCIHFLCPLRDSDCMKGCRDYTSLEIYRRTERDTPFNERKIRGLA